MKTMLNQILQKLMKNAIVKEYDSGDWHIREWASGWVEQELRYETLGSALTPTQFSGGWYYLKEYDLPVEMASNDYRAYSNFSNFGAALGSNVIPINSKHVQVVGHSVSLREDETLIMVSVSGYKKV